MNMTASDELMTASAHAASWALLTVQHLHDQQYGSSVEGSECICFLTLALLQETYTCVIVTFDAKEQCNQPCTATVHFSSSRLKAPFRAKLSYNLASFD